MKFIVGPIVGTDTSTDPASLILPAITPLGDADRHAASCRSTRKSRRTSGHHRRGWQHRARLRRSRRRDIWPHRGPVGHHGGRACPIPLHWGADIAKTPVLGRHRDLGDLSTLRPTPTPSTSTWCSSRSSIASAGHRFEDGMTVIPAQLVGDPRDPEPWELGSRTRSSPIRAR